MDHALYEVSINDSMFEPMRNNFDVLLTEMLHSMQRKESDSGELTLKVKISLVKQYEETGNGKISYIKPGFEHKISSAIQIKDERKGNFNEDYMLVSENQKYYLKKVEEKQVNLFFMGGKE